MKKFLCLALVLLLLLPMTIACKKDEQPQDGTTPGGSSDVSGGGSSSSSDSSEPLDEDDPKNKYDFGILNKLPQANYNGKAFNVSLESEHTKTFNADKINGDTQNDTLYKWLVKVENHFGVDVKASATNGSNQEYATGVLADLRATSTTYHLYGIRAFQSWQCSVNNVFADWNSLNSSLIDLEDAQRWDVTTNDAVTFNGKFYTATGDLGTSKLKMTMATFYHVELLERYGADEGIDQDYIYGLVNSGDWTLAAMEEIAKSVYADNNNNGSKDVGDTFGYISATGNSYDIWVPAMGITAVEEVNGRPKAVLNQPEKIAKLTKVRDFYHNNQGVMPASNGSGDQYYTNVSETSAFINTNALFITTTFSAAYDNFREIGTDAYGMMPQPKYDEHQDYYMSYINDNYTVWGVNNNLTMGEERDFTAHITDALCAESANSVYYEFYDIMLKQKYSKDKATAQMVDKVMENVLCDSTRQFGNYLTDSGKITGYTGAVRSYLRNADYQFTTALQGYEQTINNAGGMLDQMFEAYK